MRPVRRQGWVRYRLLSRTLSPHTVLITDCNSSFMVSLHVDGAVAVVASFMYLVYLCICRPTRKPAQAMTDELNGANRTRGQEPSEHPWPFCSSFLCRALGATGLAFDAMKRGRLRNLYARRQVESISRRRAEAARARLAAVGVPPRILLRVSLRASENIDEGGTRHSSNTAQGLHT